MRLDVVEMPDGLTQAVGRTPNGKKIAADKAGVAVTDRGFINVDIQMRTNVPHIFAVDGSRCRGHRQDDSPAPHARREHWHGGGDCAWVLYGCAARAEVDIRLVGLIQQRLEFDEDRWNLHLDCFPHHVGVYVKVGVNQAIAHANNRLPWNVGICQANILRNPVGCLADHFDGAKHCEQQHLIRLQVAALAPCHKLQRCLRCLYHVEQANAVFSAHIAFERCP